MSLLCGAPRARRPKSGVNCPNIETRFGCDLLIGQALLLCRAQPSLDAQRLPVELSRHGSCTAFHSERGMTRRSGPPRKALTNAAKHHRTMLVRRRLPRERSGVSSRLTSCLDPVDRHIGRQHPCGRAAASVVVPEAERPTWANYI